MEINKVKCDCGKYQSQDKDGHWRCSVCGMNAFQMEDDPYGLYRGELFA